MTTSKIIICENRSDTPEDHSAIVISELLTQIDTQESYELFSKLIDVKIDNKDTIPVYSILSEVIWRNTYQLHDNTTRWMETLPLLYKLIDDKIGDEIDIIECIGVSGRHLDMVHDLSQNRDIQMEVRESPEETVTDHLIAIRAIGWWILSVFDGLLSLFLKPFFSSTDADVLVKYPLFRPDAFRPIEDKIDISFDITFTLFTMSYFLRAQSTVADKDSVIPLRCFDTFRGMISSYWTLAALGYDLVLTREQEFALVDAVEEETGIRMEKTVRRLYQRAVLGNIKPLLYATIAQRLFEKNTYESLLITSTGPTAKALCIPASDNDVTTYVLHHSITTPVEIYDESYDRTLFSEGKIVDYALQATDNKRMTSINTGLPKHLDIADRRKNSSTTEKDGTIVLATQSFDDRLRRDFIYNIVPVILEETSWDIVIKTHPSEETEFYARILEEYTGTLSTGRIQITEMDLYTHIQQSDLLITVNSNVGLEAIILGTPTLTYNMWEPEIRDALYTIHGSVPSCSTAEELRTLLADCDLDKLRTDQQQMLTDLYMIKANSIEQIADKIQMELKNSTAK